MPCVLRFGAYSDYIHAEGSAPHHLPHCQVRWPAGGSVRESLLTWRPLEGDLARAVLDEL